MIRKFQISTLAQQVCFDTAFILCIRMLHSYRVEKKSYNSVSFLPFSWMRCTVPRPPQRCCATIYFYMPYLTDIIPFSCMPSIFTASSLHETYYSHPSSVYFSNEKRRYEEYFTSPPSPAGSEIMSLASTVLETLNATLLEENRFASFIFM